MCAGFSRLIIGTGENLFSIGRRTHDSWNVHVGENFYSRFVPWYPAQGLNITADFWNLVLCPFLRCLLLCTVSVTRGSRIQHWTQIIPYVGVLVHRPWNVASDLIRNDRLVENRCKAVLASCDFRNSFLLVTYLARHVDCWRFPNKKKNRRRCNENGSSSN